MSKPHPRCVTAVRLIAAAAPAPPRRITWRRAFVVAVPIAAAVAATIVFTRPTNTSSRVELAGAVDGHDRPAIVAERRRATAPRRRS